MNVVSNMYRNINNGFKNNPDRKVTPEQVLEVLSKKYNYEYPRFVFKTDNQMIVSNPLPQLLQYSYNQFKTIYMGMISYIRKYISWLNLFCYEYFLDVKFKDSDNKCTDVDSFKANLLKYCSMDKCSASSKTEFKKVPLSNIPSMPNTLHLFTSMLINTKNQTNNNDNYCPLTEQFIMYIKIYIDSIVNFRAAYLSPDIDKIKKSTVTFKDNYHSKLKKYANFILKQLNVLFEQKISENPYLVYNNSNISPQYLKPLQNNVSKNVNDSIKRNILVGSTKKYSSHYYHTVLDAIYDDRKDINTIQNETKRIMKTISSGGNIDVYLCILSENKKKILLFKNKKTDKWTILGGRILIMKKQFKITVKDNITLVPYDDDEYKNYIIINRRKRVYWKTDNYSNLADYLDLKENNKTNATTNIATKTIDFTTCKFVDIETVIQNNIPIDKDIRKCILGINGRVKQKNMMNTATGRIARSVKTMQATKEAKKLLRNLRRNRSSTRIQSFVRGRQARQKRDNNIKKYSNALEASLNARSLVSVLPLSRKKMKGKIIRISNNKYKNKYRIAEVRTSRGKSTYFTLENADGSKRQDVRLRKNKTNNSDNKSKWFESLNNHLTKESLN